MTQSIYNAMKLSAYRPLFLNRRVLIVGAGAVGTHLMEFFAKMGLSPDVIDFDVFTLENASKHSSLIRTPEDAGKNKATCTSERVKPLLDEGCTSNGIDCELSFIGPEAFTDYDFVVVAVDNLDAKVLLNELIRQIPQARRPIVIMTGTYDEMAQSVILDNTSFCLRCLIDDSWMKDSSIRTSCTGPQVREVNGVDEIVRTSNLASSMAAHLSAEQLRASVIGEEKVMNSRLTYTAYPRLELGQSFPKKRCDCPGCSVQPPTNIEWLKGDVLTLTLRDAINQISTFLGTTDFEVSTYRLHYRKVVYSGFVVDDVCHACGKVIPIGRHESRLFLDDLLCKDCRDAGKEARYSPDFSEGKIIRAFSKENFAAFQTRTLFELGYPLGGYIEVIQRNGAIDFLDENRIVRTIFACSEDHHRMHDVQRL